MVLNAIQVFGFGLGILSWIGMIGTCASPEWRKNSQGQTLIDSQLRYDGLWVRCTAFVTGQTQCESYNAFFVGLPGVLQTCRAFVVASITVGFVAILVAVFGLKCTTIGPKNHQAKRNVAIVGGLLFGVAGVTTVLSSYFAFLWAFGDNYDVMKSLFINLGASGGSLLASMFIILGSCSSLTKDENIHKQRHQCERTSFKRDSFTENSERAKCFCAFNSKKQIYVSDYI